MNKDKYPQPTDGGGLFPWDHPTISACLEKQVLPDGSRSCFLCHQEQGPDAKVRFHAYKNDTHRYLFMSCQQCSERPETYFSMIEMVRRGEGLTKYLVSGG